MLPAELSMTTLAERIEQVLIEHRWLRERWSIKLRDALVQAVQESQAVCPHDPRNLTCGHLPCTPGQCRYPARPEPSREALVNIFGYHMQGQRHDHPEPCDRLAEEIMTWAQGGMTRPKPSREALATILGGHCSQI